LAIFCLGRLSIKTDGRFRGIEKGLDRVEANDGTDEGGGGVRAGTLHIWYSLLPPRHSTL
jgi:hypothetical protein